MRICFHLRWNKWLFLRPWAGVVKAVGPQEPVAEHDFVLIFDSSWISIQYSKNDLIDWVDWVTLKICYMKCKSLGTTTEVILVAAVNNKYLYCLIGKQFWGIAERGQLAGRVLHFWRTRGMRNYPPPRPRQRHASTCIVWLTLHASL